MQTHGGALVLVVVEGTADGMPAWPVCDFHPVVVEHGSNHQNLPNHLDGGSPWRRPTTLHEA